MLGEPKSLGQDSISQDDSEDAGEDGGECGSKHSHGGDGTETKDEEGVEGGVEDDSDALEIEGGFAVLHGEEAIVKDNSEAEDEAATQDGADVAGEFSSFQEKGCFQAVP